MFDTVCPRCSRKYDTWFDGYDGVEVPESVCKHCEPKLYWVGHTASPVAVMGAILTTIIVGLLSPLFNGPKWMLVIGGSAAMLVALIALCAFVAIGYEQRAGTWSWWAANTFLSACMSLIAWPIPFVGIACTIWVYEQGEPWMKILWACGHVAYTALFMFLARREAWLHPDKEANTAK